MGERVRSLYALEEYVPWDAAAGACSEKDGVSNPALALAEVERQNSVQQRIGTRMVMNGHDDNNAMILADVHVRPLDYALTWRQILDSLATPLCDTKAL
jgi:hypothetical protein